MRGDKTTLTLNDKGKLQKKVEKFGDTNELGKAVKKGEWNTYRITNGYIIHYINGVKMSELLIMMRRHAGRMVYSHFKSTKGRR